MKVEACGKRCFRAVYRPSFWRANCTCNAIHVYVFFKPSASGCVGRQPNFSAIKLLSELRPRTPTGPGICDTKIRLCAMVAAIWTS